MCKPNKLTYATIYNFGCPSRGTGDPEPLYTRHHWFYKTVLTIPFYTSN